MGTSDPDAIQTIPRVVLQVPGKSGIQWAEFVSPLDVLEARTLAEVVPLLDRLDIECAAGRFVAGFVSYEAAPAFDEALLVHQGDGPPLAWFGIFDDIRHRSQPGRISDDSIDPIAWEPSVAKTDYCAAVDRIRQHIAAGDTYQVNLTFPLEADCTGVEPWSLFADLCSQQRSTCCAFVETTEWALCSASPELFFKLDGDYIESRPMKGTAGRGRTIEEDQRQAEWLQNSSKNRAENVMIVDMVRNDLGRIATPESVKVSRLWELEKYPSIFQLTSTVEARTNAPLSDIFKALFPCASITGAPKIRASEIISELETHTRGVYTGSIGYAGPNRQARFNVAIRTVQIDKRHGRARFGTGGGIVWESSAEDEWLECRTKALILRTTEPDFELFETLLWKPHDGYRLLQRHLERLQQSALYFDFALDLEDVQKELDRCASCFEQTDYRVRLTTDISGAFRVEANPFDSDDRIWRVALARVPIDVSNRFLFHKTTNRQLYGEIRSGLERYDDVLLWNTDGQVTESTIANLVVRFGDSLHTPPVEAGLLPGTMRAELLQTGRIVEREIRLEQLAQADEVFLINSVRGWIRVSLDDLDVAPENPSPASTLLAPTQSD